MKIRDRSVFQIFSVFAFLFLTCCVIAYEYFINGKTGINEIFFIQKVLTSLYFSAVLLVAIISVIFLKQALSPLSYITYQLGEINVGNLHKRIKAGKKNDEIYQLSAALNKMLGNLEESIRLQKTFAANVTHELKGPLTGLMSEVEQALLKDHSPQEYKQMLVSFQERLQSFNRMSNDILKLMELNFDISRISLVPLRLDELVWLAVAEMKKRIPGREVSVDIQVEDHNIPDSFYVIHGNKELLLIAIGNVLDNAAKYSSSNALIEVILRLNKNKGNTIEINDHGVGMKQEDLFNIGQPFFRAESVKHIQGHGIGLSLVNQIMNIHNAFVDIKSVPGYGTSVHFNFPIK